MAEPAAYAIMATLTDTTKVTLPTINITRGQIRHQSAPLNLTTHTRSTLGGTYAQLLADPGITQFNNNLALLQYNQTKGLIGRPNDTIAWATTCWLTPMFYKRMMKACKSKSRRTSPSSKQINKNKKRPHPTEPPHEHAQQPSLKQRERQDVTNGHTNTRPTQTDEPERRSMRKVISSTE